MDTLVKRGVNPQSQPFGGEWDDFSYKQFSRGWKGISNTSTIWSIYHILSSMVAPGMIILFLFLDCLWNTWWWDFLCGTTLVARSLELLQWRICHVVNRAFQTQQKCLRWLQPIPTKNQCSKKEHENMQEISVTVPKNGTHWKTHIDRQGHWSKFCAALVFHGFSAHVGRFPLRSQFPTFTEPTGRCCSHG